MDLGVTIIGAILIAICIVPIILMGRNRKNIILPQIETTT
jgi:hypothetical protein